MAAYYNENDKHAAAWLRELIKRRLIADGFWRDADWLFCRDGKWRPVEPSLEPLVNGVSARVVRLRGYGNAINPHQAAVFIRAAMK